MSGVSSNYLAQSAINPAPALRTISGKAARLPLLHFVRIVTKEILMDGMAAGQSGM